MANYGEIPAAAVAGYYRLNGNSTETSGSGRDGTDTNITYGVGNGKLSQGALFNGSSSKIVVASNSAFNLGSSDFTFKMMVKFGASPSGVSLFSRDFGGGPFNKWFFNHSIETSGHITFLHYAFPGATRTEVDFGAWSPSTGVWYHVVMTKTGSTWNLFIDGNLFATVSQALTIADIAATPLDFGEAEGAFFLNGNMDELLYKVGEAWSANKVRLDYATIKGRLTPSMM